MTAKDEYYSRAMSAVERLNDEAEKLIVERGNLTERVAYLESILESVLATCGGSEHWQGETHEFLKRIEQALSPEQVEAAKAMSLEKLEVA